MQFVPGCCNCGIPFSGQVIGCNSLATGLGVMTVVLKNGATVIWTGSTDANGHYSGTVPSLPSPITVEIASPPTGFLAFSGSKTVGGTPKVIANVVLAVDTANYICVPGCVKPWPLTLHTSVTGLTLVYTNAIPGNGLAGWYGCVSFGGGIFPFALYADTVDYVYTNNSICTGPGGTVCGWNALTTCPANLPLVSFTAGLTRTCDPVLVTINFTVQHVTCGIGCSGSPGDYPWYPSMTISP